MESRHDIQNHADIRLLVDSFYTKATKDPLIGFFFTEVVALDWEVHMPKMYAFWDSILFGTPGFKGDPMAAHLLLNKKAKMTHEHFLRWLSLFTSTVDELFEGKKAGEIKQRAAVIANMMELKVQE